MSADAYAVLGVSPDSEDVVIRAAYRALMQKYTSLSRLDADVIADDRRAREIQAAYDHVEALRRAPAAPPPPPAPWPQTPWPQTPWPQPSAFTPAEPAALEPDHPATPLDPPPRPEPEPEMAQTLAGAPLTAAARRAPRRASLGPWLIAATLTALAAVGAAMVLSPERDVVANPTASPGLKVRLTKPAPAASLARPLPCFVAGKRIGELRLADCAARNGVATGPLDLPPQPSAGDPAGADPLPLVPPQASAPAPLIALALPPKGDLPPVVRAAPERPRREPHFAQAEPEPRPVDRTQGRAHPLAALDKALRDPLATLMRAMTRPAPGPGPSARAEPKPVATAKPAPKPAAAPAEDQLDRLLAMLAPLARGPAHEPPAPRPEPPAAREPTAAPTAPLERSAERVEVSAPPAERPTARQSLAVVRGFYEALGDGDAATAVSLVAPEKRQEGSLSASRIRKFYSAVRQPLRLTAIRPLDDATVLVRYQFVAPGDRLCEGVANVGTTAREQAVLIDQIRARYACQG